MSKTDGKELDQILQGCLKQDREAQRKLYQHFFGYTMSICARYCQNLEEAKEVLNDGFMKVFTRLQQYDPKKAFKAVAAADHDQYRAG